MISALNRVRYVCNAGVLLESGGKKVLIDGLINHGHKIFDKYSPQLESKIIKGEEPFDNLDLVLGTHFHTDHFDRHIMADFCRRHPRVPVLGSPQVMALLRPELPVDAALLEIDPGRYEHTRLELNGVDLTAVSLLHSGKEYEDAVNLGYVLRLGRTFVHTGDALNSRPNIEALRRAGAGKPPAASGASSGQDKGHPSQNGPISGLVQSGASSGLVQSGASSALAGTGAERQPGEPPRGPVAIAPFPYLTLPLAFKKFCSLLEPECLFIMHLPNDYRDPGGWIEATHKAWDRQRDSGLRIILAKHEGDAFDV